MSIDGDFDGDDIEIIDHSLFELAKKHNDDDEDFDWDNDDIVDTKNDKLNSGTAFTRMIRAYLDLPPFWSLMVSLTYLTCFLLIFFLMDYLLFIEDKKANWRYWKSKHFNIKGYPLFIWSIYLEISLGSFFILRYFFIIFPDLLLRISDILFGGITEKFRHYTIDYIKYLHNYITFTTFMMVSSIAFPNVFVEYKDKYPFAGKLNRFIRWVLIASIIWLIEKFFFQTFAMKFHKKAFEERIKKVKYSISVLEKFYRAYNNEDTSGMKSPIKRRFVSRLRNIVRRNNDGTLLIRNSSDAKRLARMIFEFLRPSDETQFLVLDDFKPFFGNVEQAQHAFNIFDVDKNGDISRFEIKNIIISIYKEKEDIEKSMRDSGLALKKLDGILKFLAIIIIGFVGLIMFVGQDEYTTIMISVGTVWASTMFAISGIITTIVENIIFLFISHPFDVGDKIQVGSDVMYVTEFGLISTVFRRTNGKKVYCPNKKISSQFIKNVRRSGTIVEDIDLEISLNTTTEQLDELKRRILEFLKEHKNDFQLKAEIALKSLKDVGHINLGIMIEHNINFQDTYKYNIRRNELLLTIQSLLNDIGISLYHENSYDVQLTCSNPKKLPIIAALSSNVPFTLN